jgi:hypothetical protein
MDGSISRILLLGLLLLALPVLQGCNKVWATWKDKTISVTTASDGIELVTKADAAEINIGRRRIVLTDDSVSMDGRQQSVSRYRRVVVTEEAGALKLTLDGKPVL